MPNSQSQPSDALAESRLFSSIEPQEQWNVGPQMPDKKKERAEQGERHAREVEASQKAMRESISETERLVDESEKMLRRHRGEREESD